MGYRVVRARFTNLCFQSYQNNHFRRGYNLGKLGICLNLKEIPYVPLACPSDGAFIGWKKVGRYLVKLEIPEDARRSSATTNKCRCDKAKVLDIICMSDDHPLNLQEITNFNYTKATYKVGEMVYPDSFDEDRWNECSHGIHFFINKQDAINN